jgi:VanZ family protein
VDFAPGSGYQVQTDTVAAPGFGRRRLGKACAAYGLLMLYASTVIGPSGMHFVYQDPGAAFRIFLATPYVINGSDQRADWMGNLLMLVPFGFMTTGALWPRRCVLRPLAVFGAILASVATIVAIKYLQLFFPPRTVTLNYIAAQTLGAVAGCAGFVCCARCIGRPTSVRDPVAGLIIALRLYFAVLVLFLLMPLDFALDATDLRAQIARLPEAVTALPGSNRPPEVRALLVAVAGAAFIPVGMLMTFVRTSVYRAQRSLWAVAGRGLLINSIIFGLTTLLISGYPAMASILYRTGGMVTGAAVILWLMRQDPARLRQWLRKLAPWMVVPYVFVLLLVSRLLSRQWLSLDDALAQAYPLGFLPLFDYYIVSKAEAAKNIAGHALLYAPIGILLWMRYGVRTEGRALALAMTMAFMVEAARYFRPGLEGDVNTIAVAGVSAMLATRLMQPVWLMLEDLARRSAGATAGRHRRDRRAVAGDVLSVRTSQ